MDEMARSSPQTVTEFPQDNEESVMTNSLAHVIQQAENDLKAIETKILDVHQAGELKLVALQMEIKKKMADKQEAQEKLSSFSRVEQLWKASEYNTATKESEKAEAALVSASEDLAEAEKDLMITQGALLEAKSVITNRLNELKSGKLDKLDPSGAYAAPTRIDEPVVITEVIPSVFEKKAPLLEATRDALIQKKAILEEVTELKSQLLDKNERMKEISSDRKEMTADLNDLEKVVDNVKNIQQRVLNSMGKWRQRWQRLNHFFGRDTSYDKRLKTAIALVKQKVEEKKKAEDRIKNTDTKILEIKLEINELEEKITKMDAEVGLDTPAQLDEKIQAINVELNRSVDLVKSALIERCKPDDALGIMRDRETEASRRVKKDLEHFLLEPTNTSLSVLMETMKSNPSYLVDLKLTKLLSDVRRLYSEVPLPEQNFLSISPEKLVQLFSEEIQANDSAIEQLERQKASLAELLQTSQLSMVQQTQKIETNRSALKEVYRLLFAAEKLAISSKGSEDEQATTDVIEALKDKIQQIQENLPKADVQTLAREDAMIRKHSVGVVLNYDGCKDEIAAILEKYQRDSNHVPVTLNEKTVNQFIANLTEEAEAEVRAQIAGVPDIEKQVDEGVKWITGLANKVGFQVDRLRASETARLNHAYDQFDAIDAQIGTDIKSRDTWKKALDDFNTAINASNSDQETHRAFVDFKNKMDRFDLPLKDICHDARQAIEDVIKPKIFEEDIQWIEDVSLKTIDLAQSAQKNKMLENDIQDMTHKIASLQDLNASLDERRVLAEKGEAHVITPTKVEALIQECSKPLVFNNSVRIALKDFLSAPTQTHLNSLAQSMQKDSSYLTNEKLKPLIEKAADFYPEVGEVHQRIKFKEIKGAVSELKSTSQAAQPDAGLNLEGNDLVP